MPKFYPPLPMHEQIVRHRVPAWWNNFEVKTEPSDTPLLAKKKYRSQTVRQKVYGYVRPQDWTPYKYQSVGQVQLGIQQRWILWRMGLEKDRWFTWSELKSWSLSVNLHYTIGSLVSNGFLQAAPADDRQVKSKANGHLPHQWKYKFLKAADEK